MRLAEYIKQERPFAPDAEAMLNIVVTSSWLMSEMASEMAPFGVTPSQYNVLRILGGSHPKKLTCTEVGQRLLDRTPDVTRLLGRLQKAGFVERTRADYDRRVVEVSITPPGLELLTRMRPVVDAASARLTRHLDGDEQRQLTHLLEKLRSDQ